MGWGDQVPLDGSVMEHYKLNLRQLLRFPNYLFSNLTQSRKWSGLRKPMGKLVPGPFQVLK
jgi:hypothetical protein